MQTAEMLRTHSGQPNEALASIIGELASCGQTCCSCADACPGEDQHLTELVPCMPLNLDCADVCDATAQVLTRRLNSR